MFYATYHIIMFILSQMGMIFFRFPSKHLGRIVHGLCFSWVNVSSIRYIYVLTPKDITESLVVRDALNKSSPVVEKGLALLSKYR